MANTFEPYSNASAAREIFLNCLLVFDIQTDRLAWLK